MTPTFADEFARKLDEYARELVRDWDDMIMDSPKALAARASLIAMATRGAEDAARLTREQAAIIGVYSGILCGPFSDLHKKIEDVLGRPVWTHEMANKELMDSAKAAIKDEFLTLVAIDAAQPNPHADECNYSGISLAKAQEYWHSAGPPADPSAENALEWAWILAMRVLQSDLVLDDSEIGARDAAIAAHRARLSSPPECQLSQTSDTSKPHVTDDDTSRDPGLIVRLREAAEAIALNPKMDGKHGWTCDEAADRLSRPQSEGL